MNDELLVKRKFAKTWGRWMCFCEAARGGTTGAPDCLVLHRGKVFPIEIKTATVDLYGDLLVSNVRSTQLRWHRRFRDAGGESLFLIGTFLPDQSGKRDVHSLWLADSRSFQKKKNVLFLGDNHPPMAHLAWRKGMDSLFADEKFEGTLAKLFD